MSKGVRIARCYKARNTKPIKSEVGNTTVSNAEFKWNPERIGKFHGLSGSHLPGWDLVFELAYFQFVGSELRIVHSPFTLLLISARARQRRKISLQPVPNESSAAREAGDR